MKKKIYLLMLILGAFMIVGFSCNKDDNTKTEEESSVVQDDDSVVDNFKDALSLNNKMKCTYKASDEGQSYESTSYIEGDKYKTEYSTAGVNYISIFDGKTMYSWDENTKQGTQMDIDCLNDLETTTEDDGTDSQDVEEYQSSEEILDTGVDVSCRKVNSIDFTVPSDVELVDQCALLKQQMESLENLQNQLPDLEGLDLP